MSEDRAVCATLSVAEVDRIFFADRDQLGRLNEAKAMCMECPLYWSCQEYAVEEGIPHGVFGGLSGDDRKRIWAGEGRKRPNGFDQAIDAALRTYDGKRSFLPPEEQGVAA